MHDSVVKENIMKNSVAIVTEAQPGHGRLSRYPVGSRVLMSDTGEIGRHLGNLRLEALIEHFLQFVVLPPGLGDVMVGEDLSIIGCKKSGRCHRDDLSWIEVVIRGGCPCAAAAFHRAHSNACLKV